MPNRLELTWETPVYPRTQDKIDAALRDLTSGAPVAEAHPRVVLCASGDQPLPMARYALLVADVPYSRIRHLGVKELVVFTTDPNLVLRMGAAAVGQRVGDWQGRPAVGVQVGTGDSISLIGWLSPWKFARLPTHSLSPDGRLSSGAIADPFTEHEIADAYGDTIPLVTPPWRA